MTRMRAVAPAEEAPLADVLGVWSKDSTIAYLVREAHRALSADLQARIGRYGVNAGMWRFLRVLWEEDAISQRDLSARVGMTAATTALALDRMEREALVLRVRDGKDRRVVRIHLTKKGRRMRDKLLPHAAEVDAVACAGLSPQNVALVKELLTRMRVNIETGGALASAAKRRGAAK
jgi:MarR family transcriptional regulator, organic hydroperoxide resistance regulator